VPDSFPFTMASLLLPASSAFFPPWGVPLEDRDREDECPFVSICP